jgi:SAM-dependent methyltransferase
MEIFGEQVGHPHTGRGIDEMDRRFGVGVIEGAIARRSAAGAQCRVLEIGCGEGRVLMELRSRFPDAEFHGINRSPWPAMRGSEDLLRVAEFYAIPAPAADRDVPLPAIHFCDAAALPFPSEHFDVVMSQTTFHSIERKDRAIEEILRTLKPSGEAHLHLDSTRGEGEDKCPRFVISCDGTRKATTEYLTERCSGLASMAWHFAPSDHGGWFTVLRMQKCRTGQVQLGLTFDEAGSSRLKAGNTPAWLHYGFQSIYELNRAEQAVAR